MKISYIILILIICFSCSKSVGKEDAIIPKEKMVCIVADIQKSQEFVRMFPDSIENLSNYRREKYFQDIYIKYNITEQDYDKSLNYYLSEPDTLKAILEQAKKTLIRDAS